MSTRNEKAGPVAVCPNNGTNVNTLFVYAELSNKVHQRDAVEKFDSIGWHDCKLHYCTAFALPRSIHLQKCTAYYSETFAGAATSDIVSASPWYKRPSSTNKPFTFFLTRSTLFKLTHCCPSFTNFNCFVFRCRALYAPSEISPAFFPQQQPMLVMLSDKHTRNVFLLLAPSDHAAKGVLAQAALARTPLWLTMMKPYLSTNGHQDPKQANGNDSGQLALSPQVLICPPLLGHHPMVTSLLDRSKVIIRPMKDGDGKKTFKLGPIVTMSCHQGDSNVKIICIASKPHGNPLQALVAPDGQRNYSANPPEQKSHLFLAQVHPPNHLRTF
ncbi:hypothetical protein O181_097931 [Austropuccinia psidii MF-1]|uniref:Uncharacterized protein n=1 Tax=Austropuccinia psidii MF-1 TaxID=1389203 RepID=A0A9Q3PFI3_9BASI|nr:hypothetical protein [Austropuccinia psidii MF-1]